MSVVRLQETTLTQTNGKDPGLIITSIMNLFYKKDITRSDSGFHSFIIDLVAGSEIGRDGRKVEPENLVWGWMDEMRHGR